MKQHIVSRAPRTRCGLLLHLLDEWYWRYEKESFTLCKNCVRALKKAEREAQQ